MPNVLDALGGTAELMQDGGEITDGPVAPLSKGNTIGKKTIFSIFPKDGIVEASQQLCDTMGNYIFRKQVFIFSFLMTNLLLFSYFKRNI